MTEPVPFWKTKPLEAMTRDEWESLCDGCGRCCLHKLRDEDSGALSFTTVACRLLDLNSCACSNYADRARHVPDCVSLTPEALRAIDWLPPSCAYVLVAQGKDLASEAQIEATKSAEATAQSQLIAAKAKESHDRVLYDYANIRAPFSGVVTQRYANLGTLMQGGTNSSTQALPLVRLSQDDKFRLVIPVPESYVKYIRTGDPVQVRVPSLNKIFPGKVARFSVDVSEDTRTMHTEVDVPNPSHELVPGLYAEATLMLERKADALTVPLQAVDRNGGQSTIMLVDASDRVQQRTIELGLQTASDAEVLTGLNEGDRVIVSDRSGLKQGAPVHAQVTPVLEYQSAKSQ